MDFFPCWLTIEEEIVFRVNEKKKLKNSHVSLRAPYNSDGVIAYFDSVQLTQDQNNVFTYFRMESFGLKKIPSQKRRSIYFS